VAEEENGPSSTGVFVMDTRVRTCQEWHVRPST
jgi:hypothetical protein